MPTIKRRFPRGALILGGLLLALVLLVPITSLISLTRIPMEQNPMAKILPMPWDFAPWVYALMRSSW